MYICACIDRHNKEKQSFSDVTELDDISCCSHNLDCTGSQAAICVVHIVNNRRYLSVSNAKRKAYISGNINYNLENGMHNML